MEQDVYIQWLSLTRAKVEDRGTLYFFDKYQLLTRKNE